TRSGIEAIIEKVDSAFARIDPLIWENDFGDLSSAAQLRSLATLAHAQVAQVTLLVDVEVEVDRIQSDYGCQQCLVADDEVTLADNLTADAPCDRRAYFCELEVEFGSVKRG